MAVGEGIGVAVGRLTSCSLPLRVGTGVDSINFGVIDSGLGIVDCSAEVVCVTKVGIICSPVSFLGISPGVQDILNRVAINKGISLRCIDD